MLVKLFVRGTVKLSVSGLVKGIRVVKNKNYEANMKFFIVAAVGLILAVAEIHCKSVSSEPGCETEVLLDCTKRLDYLNSDKALELGASQQDLENVCPTLQDGMQCINDYSNRCLPENIQAYFQSMYNGTMLVITELCRPGDFQSGE
ncbi:unnamed protein product [Notodromas monacha]|uniref:Uncharacterized protein n=1 Tax=Notodromas monacha TaxID=399045 RepID=A0A7R9GHF4_9CRUS|nr:unnamed protein product [Notodromas monacha]CAG0921270.1 unnamed protein product [Notodromas monacha]